MKIKKYLLLLISAFILIAAIFSLWQYYALEPWTRDGRIRAEINQVTAQVSGKLTNLYITDNMEVSKGTLLLTIDKSDYEIVLRQLELELSDLTIQYNLAKTQFERRQRLNHVAVSKEETEEYKSRLDSLIQKIEIVKVKIDKAKLDLERTEIRSPVNGYITHLNLRAGNYISAGSPLFAIVDKDSYYVIAYLEETKMKHVAVGNPADIELYGTHQKLEGTVQSIGRAVADNNSSTGSMMLENVQPNYPWVRLAQRIPVRIALRDTQGEALIPGSTCTVVIHYE